MKATNQVLAEYGTSIFEVMSRLAREHQTINLGQGFPEGNGPADVVARAAEGLTGISNQYPPMLGIPELRRAVAEHDRQCYGIEVDWQTGTMVTSGATEALAATLFALIEPGDEVVVLEPLYDSYVPMIRRAGGVPVPVRLEPPEWRIDPAALAAAFSPRTKLILINSPLNPAAKVFDRSELQLIADLVQRFDTYALCDEVYEHLLFDGAEHIPLMTLPGMADRAIRVASAGKTFSITGWKVGYVTAAPALIERIARCHQFLVFTTPPNLQHAVAFGLGKGAPYFRSLATEMQDKRDRLVRGLERAGFAMLPCAGTYFVIADIRSVGFDGDDEAFCRHITEHAGVTAIPVSAFFGAGGSRDFVRFCFCKGDALLDEATARLTRHFGRT